MYVLIDVTQVHHPFHLHGHRYAVMSLGQHPTKSRMTVEDAKELKVNENLNRYFGEINPVFKDTLTIPSFGYAVIRFKADNPGYWLLHCHYEWHVHIGMALTFQVGEQWEMPKTPKDFPTCGNYLPPF